MNNLIKKIQGLSKEGILLVLSVTLAVTSLVSSFVLLCHYIDIADSQLSFNRLTNMSQLSSTVTLIVEILLVLLLLIMQVIFIIALIKNRDKAKSIHKTWATLFCIWSVASVALAVVGGILLQFFKEDFLASFASVNPAVSSLFSESIKYMNITDIIAAILSLVLEIIVLACGILFPILALKYVSRAVKAGTLGGHDMKNAMLCYVGMSLIPSAAGALASLLSLILDNSVTVYASSASPWYLIIGTLLIYMINETDPENNLTATIDQGYAPPQSYPVPQQQYQSPMYQQPQQGYVPPQQPYTQPQPPQE